MEIHKPKTIIEAIEDLEMFFQADLPSKVFPMERTDNKTFFREDYFDTKDEVGDYIKNHFKILIKQVKGLKK